MHSLSTFSVTLCDLCTLVCTAPGKNCLLWSNGPMGNLMGTALGSNQLAINMCTYATHIDAVRGVALEPMKDDAALQQNLYDNWGGVEMTTKNLTETGATKFAPYLWHRYLADFAAYTMDKAVEKTGVFEYKAYFNNTATGGSGYGNWVMNQRLMNNAIVKQYTGRSVVIHQKSWPRIFKCNRDDWLDGKIPFAQVDCDLLAGFLGISILDFLMINILPLFLMLYQVHPMASLNASHALPRPPVGFSAQRFAFAGASFPTRHCLPPPVLTLPAVRHLVAGGVREAESPPPDHEDDGPALRTSRASPAPPAPSCCQR